MRGNFYLPARAVASVGKWADAAACCFCTRDVYESKCFACVMLWFESVSSYNCLNLYDYEYAFVNGKIAWFHMRMRLDKLGSKFIVSIVTALNIERNIFKWTTWNVAGCTVDLMLCSWCSCRFVEDCFTFFATWSEHIPQCVWRINRVEALEKVWLVGQLYVGCWVIRLDWKVIISLLSLKVVRFRNMLQCIRREFVACSLLFRCTQRKHFAHIDEYIIITLIERRSMFGIELNCPSHIATYVWTQIHN